MWSKACPSEREAQDSVLRLFPFQMEIQHEWKVLAYALDGVCQATWLFPASSSVFRGWFCTWWAPGQGSGRGEIDCAYTSSILPTALLALGHPKVTGESRQLYRVARMLHLRSRRKQKRNQTAQGRSTPSANNSFRHVVHSPAHVPPTLLRHIIQETFPTPLGVSSV